MADFDYINSTGVIVPDTADIRSKVEEEFRQIFGADMPTDPSSPQGVLITAITETRDGVARNNAELANQINPELAGGVFLDALMRFTFGSRKPATYTVISGVELTGQPGTLIPAGSTAIARESNATFELTTSVVIDSSGQATGTFRATVTGPISVAPGGLDTIASGVLGWETVNNPAAAVEGKNAESDIQARQRRRATLAKQTISTVEAIYGELYDVDGVQSLSFRENVASTEQVIDGITMKPHSIYACVDGGTDADVAFVLMREKTDGAGFNGNTTVPTRQPLSGQLIAVQFDRPAETNVFIRFTVKASSVDAQSIIPDAVIQYRDGLLEGDRGFTVGKDVSPFELAGAVHQVEPSIFISRVELSTDNGATWTVNSLPIGLDEVARVTRGSVLVVVT